MDAESRDYPLSINSLYNEDSENTRARNPKKWQSVLSSQT
jgi:hypothetical protein